MRKNHIDFIQRWVHFMEEHPHQWKKVHTRFVNSQFETHGAFLKKLLEEPDGKDTILALYGIKNLNGYKKLLGN